MECRRADEKKPPIILHDKNKVSPVMYRGKSLGKSERVKCSEPITFHSRKPGTQAQCDM